MTKTIFFVTAVMVFFSGCATFVNTESKPSTHQTNPDRLPFM